MRKAGQAITSTPMGKAVLIGGGIGGATLAAVQLLKQLPGSKQDEVINEALAVQEEQGENATAFGIPAASILAAGIVLESMNRDADNRQMQELTDVVLDVNGGEFGQGNNIRRMP